MHKTLRTSFRLLTFDVSSSTELCRFELLYPKTELQLALLPFLNKNIPIYINIKMIPTKVVAPALRHAVSMTLMYSGLL